MPLTVVHPIAVYRIQERILRPAKSGVFRRSLSRTFSTSTPAYPSEVAHYRARVTLQLRMDANNALNHPNFGYSYYSSQSSVPDALSNDPTSDNFGTIQKGSNGPGNLPREIQLAGKIIF